MTGRARAKARGRGSVAARLRPHPSTFGHLALIIAEANGWAGLATILKKAGAHPAPRRGLPKQEFLYRVLAHLHESGSHGTVIRVLEAACGPEVGGKGTREKINRYLEPHGLRISEGGKAKRAARAPAPATVDTKTFDQRNYHPLVIGHARAKFLKGEYFAAVTEACKALEGLVRAKSGIDGNGDALMRQAFGDKGIMEVALPGLASKTRENLQRGLMDMCVGMVSNVRNPLSHESELKFHVGRLEALDILSTISYLCWEVGWTRRRRPGRAPRGGAARGAGGRGNASHGKQGEPHGSPGTSDTYEKEARTGRQMVIELDASPEHVTRGSTVRVTVTGVRIGGWLAGVFSEDGRVKSAPVPLEAQGDAVRSAHGITTYTFAVRTINYSNGEYRVGVSPSRRMDAAGTQIKKFVVATRDEVRNARDAKIFNNFFRSFQQRYPPHGG